MEPIVVNDDDKHLKEHEQNAKELFANMYGGMDVLPAFGTAVADAAFAHASATATATTRQTETDTAAYSHKGSPKTQMTSEPKTYDADTYNSLLQTYKEKFSHLCAYDLNEDMCFILQQLQKKFDTVDNMRTAISILDSVIEKKEEEMLLAKIEEKIQQNGSTATGNAILQLASMALNCEFDSSTKLQRALQNASSDATTRRNFLKNILSVYSSNEQPSS